MKRTPLSKIGIRHGLARHNLSARQLALIGAIALTYNDVEELIDEAAGTAIEFPFDSHQIVSRINGVDGKVAVIKSAVAGYGSTPEEIRAFAETLGNAGFAELKKYRDAVVHARVWNAEAGIGKVPERRGARAEVLLTNEALEGLLVRLEHLWHELDELGVVLTMRRRLYRGAQDVQHETRLNELLQSAMANHQSFQSQRLYLAPLPDFPVEPDTGT